MIDEILLSRPALIAMLLVGLGFILVTGVLYTLAMQKYYAIRIHDLVRETKQMRNEYHAEQMRKSAMR